MSKFSIVTVTYNSQQTLQETIDSIRKQNRSDLEYILIDGGSTDQTLKIIQNNSDIVSLSVSEPDNGISDAFNKGIRLSSGEWIGLINSDDKLADGAINALEHEIEKFKDTDIIFGNCRFFFNDGQSYLQKPDTNLDSLYRKMSLFHPAVFIRKSAYLKCGLYKTNLKCVMDRELLLRMFFNKLKFHYFDYELAEYRVGGLSARNVYTVTASENEKISIEYGLPRYKARLDKHLNNVKFFGSTYLEDHPYLERIIRKLLKKERNYSQ